jgi:hypothetical protein
MTNVATRSLARLDDYCRNDTERLGYCCTSDFARVRCKTTIALIGNDAAAAADEPGRGGLPAVTAPAATTVPRGLVTGAEMPACWDDEGL